MTKPKIVAKKPMKVSLETGDHYWCSCGESANQPFCDGSHRGTDFKPTKFTTAEDGDSFLCLCKYTNNAPHCDGTHSKLKEDVAKQQPQQSDQPMAAENTPEEPTVELIHALARDGLEKTGHHGEMAAMGSAAADFTAME